MFVDIFVSLLIAFLIGLLTDQLSLMFVLFGIIGGLLVDLDFLIWLKKNNWKVDEYSHEHRDYFHYPIVYTGIFSIFCYFLLGPEWALLWFVTSLWHFIHDTYSGGWGIRWLYPFDKGYYTFASYSPKRYYKDRQEQRKYVQKDGDPNWLAKEAKNRWIYLALLAVSIFSLILISLFYGL